MSLNNGAPSGNGVICVPPTVGNQGVETDLTNNVNPLSPSGAGFVDPGQAGYSAGLPIVPVNTIVSSSLHRNISSVKFVNPA